MQHPQGTDPLIGTAVGSYQVERKLGEGGMGAVYALLHPGIGKRLALKLLHAEYAARPQIVQRFFDEARAVNLIGHPNIVDIIDFAQLPDGRSYITMEYLEGESLAAYIRRSGALPTNQVSEIAGAICSALQAAHQAGIVHRDLKPENIHLVPRPDNERYVKVLDFGIAKLSSDLHNDPSAATRSGVVMGTPTYMSPEQAMGRTKEIDHRTDVYALGVIVYEMLAGEVPFSAESFGDLMLKHLQAEPPPLRDVRPDLAEPWSQVVHTALAKQREHRFQSMQDFAQAVQAAAGGQAVPAASAGQRTVAVTPQGMAGGAPPIPMGSPTPTPMPPHPGTVALPGGGVPSTYPPPGTQPGTGSRKAVAFALAGVVAAAAAVVVLLMSRGGDDGGEPVAAPAADAGLAAAAPIDAAVVAAVTPDAAPVIAALPPDAAPATKPAPDPVIKRPRGKATLIVRATPYGQVFVDGKDYGYTPRTIEVDAGRHKVKIVYGEADQPYTKTVNLKPGQKQVVEKKWAR
ncbi:MAG TPA: serine/threonine-protein kinase [Kofleriaceae bacterium]|nr:serine/threonine-protein kinase [Kofleriaceae bacterium]